MSNIEVNGPEKGFAVILLVMLKKLILVLNQLPPI